MNVIRQQLLALALIISCAFSHSCWGQDKVNHYPEVGDQFPGFYFDDVRYHTKENATIDDFRTKWLVLYFWNRFCSVCMKKMPMIDSLQKEFSDDFKFLLVGYTGSQYTKKSDNLKIRDLYTRLRKDYKLSLPIAYDSTLFHRLNIGACPYIIVISPEQTIKGITVSIDKNQINRLLKGDSVSFQKAYRRNEG